MFLQDIALVIGLHQQFAVLTVQRLMTGVALTVGLLESLSQAIVLERGFECAVLGRGL